MAVAVTERVRWSLRPPLWALLATVAGCALTASLGVWQLQRGHAKQALQARYLGAAVQAPLALGAATTPASGVQRATVQGRYEPQRALLLDNQTRQRQPGYEVWTPLRLRDGALLIVNRGWIAATGTREAPPQLPVPAGELRVQGLWRALPRPGLQLDAASCTPATDFPQLVNYPSAAELACLYGEPVLDGVLLLDPAEPGGYRREWDRVSEFPPEKHYGYAVQWFALAVTLLAIFLKLNLKRQTPSP